MPDTPTPAEQTVALCAVGGEWAKTVTANTTVEHVEQFQPTRTVEETHRKETEERTHTRTRSPGCSRCNGTGTIYIDGTERRCPSCTEEYTTTRERTTRHTDSRVKADYDLTGYPEPVAQLVKDADHEIASWTRRVDDAKSANIARRDQEHAHTVSWTEAVPCAKLSFDCDGHAFEGYRVGSAYYFERQPVVTEQAGLLSGLLASGPSITVEPSQLELVGYEATAGIDCDQCAGRILGVVDAEGAVHGMCPGCGQRLAEAGWIDRARVDDDALDEEVTAVLEQVRER
jgi:hypothetical protein